MGIELFAALLAAGVWLGGVIAPDASEKRVVGTIRSQSEDCDQVFFP